MRNLLVLALLFTILGGVAWWQLNQNTSQKDTYANSKHTMFAVEDVHQIQRIFIADRRGRKVLLERVDDVMWTYTNKATGKSYRANPGAVQTLLQTINQLRVREAVNKKAIDNAVRSLATNSTKVEIYNKEGKAIRIYYVGAVVGGGTGNHIIMQDAEQPYVGYLPRFQGTIDTRYILDEASWRDKAFIRLDPKRLEFVEVAYQDPSQRASSFRVNCKGNNQYEVLPVNKVTSPFSMEELNQANVETFIEDFDIVSAEMLIQNKKQRDTVITTPPFTVITYKADYHNEPQVIRVYAVINPLADRGDGLPGHRQRIQRYFVDIDEDNFFLAQHLVLRSLFWDYNYFFQKTSVQLLEDEAQTVERRTRLIQD